jgi:hypothetical protein
MCRSLYERLISDEFVLLAGLISTPEALRRFLVRSEMVHDIRESLRRGSITEDSIREFVSSLMKGFHVGSRFEHEMALAALAVAIERRSTRFAEGFLSDLASLKLVEMPLCIRVARECLRQRAAITRNARKDFSACRWPSDLRCRQTRSHFSCSPVSTPTVLRWFDVRLSNAKA